MNKADVKYLKNLATLRLYIFIALSLFFFVASFILYNYFESSHERFSAPYLGYLKSVSHRVEPSLKGNFYANQSEISQQLKLQAKKADFPLEINIYKFNPLLENKESGQWIKWASSDILINNKSERFKGFNAPSNNVIDLPEQNYLAIRNYIGRAPGGDKIIVEYKAKVQPEYESYFAQENRKAWVYTILFVVFFISLFAITAQIFNVVRKREREMLEKEDNLTNNYQAIFRVLDSITQGDYESPIETQNKDNNELVEALLTTRQKLHENKLTEESRNWYNKGLADVSAILRQEDNIKELGYRLLEYVVPVTKSAIGGFYRLNRESNELELYASYGYDRRKYHRSNVKIGYGITGEAAFERQSVYRTEVPSDFFAIRSGLIDDQKPVAVFVVPLLAEDILYGALEVAATRPYSKEEREFLEGLSEIIARTMHSLAVNAETRRLLEESQTMGRELQERKNELEKYTEDLRNTQIELQDSNEKLEDQIREVELSQKRLHALLLNASELILLYNSDKVLRFISPSVNRILGLHVEDLMGKNDFDRISPNNRLEFEQMFDKLLKNEVSEDTLEYEYQKANGEFIWMQCIAINKLDDPAINGILLNVNDITERKRAEAEQEMRGRMQSLSENSLDIILRLMLDTEISYINSSIVQYTNLSPETLLNVKLDDSKLSKQVKEVLHQLLGKVASTSEKQEAEAEFMSIDGEKVFTINAIPEFNKDGTLDSVLFVLHDITHRKLIELELQDKNQKITDSINYARHIQNAIIPSMKQIRKEFPESFMFYRPKDVVSGDFPWYLEKGDDTYIAAVDCTGHGVPGAMMSLIGYFLLNEINSHQEVQSPAVILDKLHAAVRYHLKQDQEGAEARDGMDVALIRVNKKKKMLQYSGAHRPLYMVRDGELQQFKGNKKAIGGITLRGDENFNDYTITIKPKDTYLIFSDGLPDQFGGPNGKKYSPKRIREIALDNENSSMEELNQVFEHDFSQWLEGNKQIDDVLLIGIKF
jgi:PAS domain S-box-containing protein